MEKSRILIIDDEPKNVKLVEAALAPLGYEMFKAYNGIEALEMLDQVNPHLIMLDLNMPLMGGISFYEKICDGKGRPRFPVFVLTARDNMKELFKSFEIEGFITKPFSIEQLAQEVSIIIYKKHGKQQEFLKRKSKKITVVENDQSTYEAIALLFGDSGYEVSNAKTAVEAIEGSFVNQPDLLLINLTLPDLAGDDAALRLQQMPKTRDIGIVLYTYQSNSMETVVVQKIAEKTGINKVVETSDPKKLLKEVDDVFNSINQEA